MNVMSREKKLKYKTYIEIIKWGEICEREWKLSGRKILLIRNIVKFVTY